MNSFNISRVAVSRKQNAQPAITLSPRQHEVFDNVVEELRHGAVAIYVAGPAGSGKTLILTLLGREIPKVQFTSFTGKACSVLRQRGASNAITLHSLLYGPPSVVTHKHGQLLRWKRREGKIDAGLIVADECSMISEKLGRDLVATGIKVLVTGDEWQLPPVSGTAFFNEPDFTLTQIHRQAAGSQPLKLATAIRQGRQVKPQPYYIVSRRQTVKKQSLLPFRQPMFLALLSVSILMLLALPLGIGWVGASGDSISGSHLFRTAICAMTGNPQSLR